MPQTIQNLRIGAFEYILAMVLSGAIGVFVIESHQPPGNVVFFRCSIGATFLAVYCVAKGLLRARRRLRYTAKELALTVLGGVCIVYNWVFFFESMAMTSITVTTMVYNIQPFLVAIFGALLFKEKFNRHQGAWLVVAFVGMVLIVGLGGAGQTPPHLLKGILFGAMAATLYAIATLIALTLKKHEPAVTVLIQMSIGTLVILPFTTLGSLHLSGTEAGHLACLGVLSTGLNYILLYSSFKKLSTGTISILTFVYPAIAVFSDVVFYEHTLRGVQMIGIVIVLFASFASTRGWKLSFRR